MRETYLGFAHLILIFLTFVAIGFIAFLMIRPTDYESCMKFPGSTAIKKLPTNCTTFWGEYFTLKESETKIEPTDINIDDWKTYVNEELGYSFKYPEKITLTENGDSVTLNHNVPYKNNGSCDLEGSNVPYNNLEDFGLRIELVNEEVILDYTDGQYQTKNLSGKYVIHGPEGCGDTNYYFNYPDNKTLVIKRANIQAFSGISTSWNLQKEEIMKIPGVISKEENDSLFDQILSTIEFTRNTVSATNSKTYCNNDLDCWCLSFTGAEFMPNEKVQSQCTKETSRCVDCYYR